MKKNLIAYDSKTGRTQKMADLGAFNDKEQILDSGEGDEPCRAYGKAFGEKVGG